MAEQNKVPKDEALKPLDQLRLVIETLDRLELSTGPSEAGRTKLSLRLHFTQPLK